MSTRAHPYDFVFALPQFEEEAFPQISADAETHEVDVTDFERFSLLATVGELMRSMLPDDSPHTAYEQFKAIVAHAFHYWKGGKRTREVDEASLRRVLGAERGNEGTKERGNGGDVESCYVQLPRNLVFARIEDGAPAEAVDGFFITGKNALIVMGLVPNRDGFSVIEVQLPDEDVRGVKAREEGEDFGNVLPGGEGRLFAVTTGAEAAKLVTLVKDLLYG